VRFKLDENLPVSSAAILTAAGHDADTVGQEGLSGAPDPDVVIAATAGGDRRVTHTTDPGDPGFTPLGRITLSFDASDDVINSPVLGEYCGASAPGGTCGA